jgi:membrane protein DedA with SNARE-associated domain
VSFLGSARTRWILTGLGLLLAVAAAGVLLAWLIRIDAVVYLARANAWLADTFIHRFGYVGIFVLMFIESSFIPFPSEIIIPPAADLARRLPDWSLVAVMVWGTAGSLAGALFNYVLARYLGRPVLVGAITRFGAYVRISLQGYLKAEALFERYGGISTFTGRLIPGIRQIISLPAGLARMNLLAFSLYTTLGAGLWVVVLGLAGYGFGADPERLAQALKTYSHGVLGGALVLLTGYALWVWLRRRAASAAKEEAR